MAARLPISGPLRLGDLLDRAFRLYRAHFWLMVMTAGIFLVPLGLVSGLTVGQLFTNLFDLLATTGSARAQPGLSELVTLGGLYGTLLVISLVAVVIGGLAILALIGLGDRLLRGERPSLGVSIRRAAGRLGWFCLMMLVQGLATAGALIVCLAPVVVIVIGGSLALTTAGNRSAAGVGAILILGATLLGVVLALVPIAYLSTRFYAAPICLLLEGHGPIASLRRSWRLTHHQFWRCLGYILLLGLLQYILTSLPLQFVQQGAMLAAGAQYFGLVTGLATGLQYIAQILWLPLMTVAQLLLYYDLRVRQEGFDLALRVARLEAEVGGMPPPGAPSPGAPSGVPWPAGGEPGKAVPGASPRLEETAL